MIVSFSFAQFCLIDHDLVDSFVTLHAEHRLNTSFDLYVLYCRSFHTEFTGPNKVQ